jgi:hypothetical protein
MSTARDDVSELRPPTGIFFTHQVIYEHVESRWNYTDRTNRRTRSKTCPTATLYTTNPTWIEPGANPGFRYERPATDLLTMALP